jgi:hypothetical protein
MKNYISHRIGSCLLLPLALACSAEGQPSEGPETEGPARVVLAPEEQGVIEFDSFTSSLVKGRYEYRGHTVAFESETLEAGSFVTLELRGMLLTATIDPSGVFDLDGLDVTNGGDTQMTEVDTTLIHAFEVALTDTYREHAQDLSALDTLNRAVTVWGDYPTSVPLKRAFYGRNERIVNHNLCGNANGPGRTFRYTWSSHTCTDVKTWGWGDCGLAEAGCSYGDDSSTTDNVFLSMHPSGSCDDGTFFGTGTSNYRCYEPDHETNTEFAYGACFGRCGGECGGGTQFTGACLDHDQCVRNGHWLVSSDCDLEFLDAAVDAVVAANCNVAFTVNYNNAGTPAEGNCPSAWINSGDGCDVGCQVIDPDCFR